MNKTFINNHRKEILKTAKAHTFPYHRYTREEINSLNVVNLVELCVYLFENKLTYTAGRLVLLYHPHVIVYAEGFYDTKTHKCHNAINGLKLFFEFGFAIPNFCQARIDIYIFIFIFLYYCRSRC